MTSSPLSHVPHDFVDTHGKLAYTALDAMSGRKVPGRLKKFPSNKTELTNALLAQYAAMLLFLKERGALLNTVRPDQLLAREQYVRARELEDARNESGERITPAQASDACGCFCHDTPAQ